jgi:hypothetical protein
MSDLPLRVLRPNFVERKVSIGFGPEQVTKIGAVMQEHRCSFAVAVRLLVERAKGPDNVVLFSGVTKLDLPADRVLEQAMGRLDKVVIAGWLKDGDEYFASSIADGADVVWLFERLKLKLLQTVDQA